MGKSNDGSSLGDRLKEYESDFELSVNYRDHIIVRLDGHKFSKFTKGFKRPFDEMFHQVMVQTTKDLLEEFNASTGYTQSDEITLVIPAQYQMKTREAEFPNVSDGDVCINRETGEEDLVQWEEVYSDREDRTDVCYFGDDEWEEHTIYGRNNKLTEFEINSFKEFNEKYKFLEILEVQNNQIYSGRVQKIASLASAFCTMKFNQYLSAKLSKYIRSENEEERKYWDLIRLRVGNAWFDARVYGVDSDEEAFNSVMWRCCDNVKNSRSLWSQVTLANYYFQKTN